MVSPHSQERTLQTGFVHGLKQGALSFVEGFSLENLKNGLSWAVKHPTEALKSFFKGLAYVDQIVAVIDAGLHGSEYDFGVALGELTAAIGIDLLINIVSGGGAAIAGKLFDKVSDASRGARSAEHAMESAAKGCSFGGATLVLMADGTSKHIEDIEVGDVVIATDPETGEQGPQKVQEVFVHEDTVVDLKVEGEALTTTEDHPFWSVTDHRFERADELTPGELILGANGTLVTVTGLQAHTARPALAYNLAIDRTHTYHVGAKHTLVHNDCGPARQAADAARANGRTQGAAAQLEIGDHVFVDLSDSGTPIHPDVLAVLMSTPESRRAPWHGACAEVGCLSQALAAGVSPQGGRMTAVQIGDKHSRSHGAVKPACASCQYLRENFGYEQK